MKRYIKSFNEIMSVRLREMGSLHAWWNGAGLGQGLHSLIQPLHIVHVPLHVDDVPFHILYVPLHIDHAPLHTFYVPLHVDHVPLGKVHEACRKASFPRFSNEYGLRKINFITVFLCFFFALAFKNNLCESGFPDFIPFSQSNITHIKAATGQHTTTDNYSSYLKSGYF